MAFYVAVAETSDHPAAIAIWRAANEARDMPPTPERAQRVQEKLQDPEALVLIAKDGATPVGMALIEPGLSDTDGSSVAGLAHVSMVFVRPERWNQGIGVALLDALQVVARKRGWGRLSLWTRASNLPARRLYERCEFTATNLTKRLKTGDLIVQYQRVL
jgi:ribosomal protein S18 acetylase RimI-like enzyme